MSTFIDRYQQQPLKGIHACKNVSYVLLYSNYTCCGLCDYNRLFHNPFDCNNESHTAIIEDHVRSGTHESRYLQLVAAQKAFLKAIKQKRFDRSEFLRDLIKTLPLDKWRWHMYGLVMEFIDAPLQEANALSIHHDLRVNIAESDRDHHGQHALVIAVRQLAKYLQVERLSLLELAIMKSKRCTCIECLVVGNIEVMPTETRIVKSGAAVIIPLVVQFLGQPPLVFV